MPRKAKGTYKRRTGQKLTDMAGYLAGNIDLDLGLATLAAKTGVVSVTKIVQEKRRVSSISCRYSLSDFTVAANTGPILVCVAHSDYSLAEIEAWIERAGSWSMSDLIADEVRQRKVRRIGIFPTPSTAGGSVLNEGRPIRTKLNWVLITGQGLQFIAYNLGTGALVTTSPNVNMQGTAHLWPVK